MRIRPLAFDAIQISGLCAIFAQFLQPALRRRVLGVSVAMLWATLVVSVVSGSLG